MEYSDKFLEGTGGMADGVEGRHDAVTLVKDAVLEVWPRNRSYLVFWHPLNSFVFVSHWSKIHIYFDVWTFLVHVFPMGPAENAALFGWDANWRTSRCVRRQRRSRGPPTDA